MLSTSTLVVLFVLFGKLSEADAQPMCARTRGTLWYSTRCIAGHGAQIHWRKTKIVTHWTSLHSQVRRWQAVSGLGWTNEDNAEVARYLSALHYRYLTPD